MSFLLLFLLVFRLFAAIVIDPIFAFHWPADIEYCHPECHNKSLPILCNINCDIRQKMLIDLTEYFKVDTVTSIPNVYTQIIGFQAIILSALLIPVVFGSFTRAVWTKKLGLLCVGLYINMLGPYFAKIFVSSPDPWQVVMFNSVV